MDLGRGGEFTIEKARLALAMRPGTLQIYKAKNWLQPDKNPNGKFLDFNLVNGCDFRFNSSCWYDLGADD